MIIKREFFKDVSDKFDIKERQSKSGEILIEENRHINKKSKLDHEKIKDYINSRFALFSRIDNIKEKTLEINNQMDTIKGILDFGATRNTGKIADDYISYLDKVSTTEDRSEEEVLLDKNFNKIIFEFFFRTHEINCSLKKIRENNNDNAKASVLKGDLIKLFVSEGFLLSDLVDFIIKNKIDSDEQAEKLIKDLKKHK